MMDRVREQAEFDCTVCMLQSCDSEPVDVCCSDAEPGAELHSESQG